LFFFFVLELRSNFDDSEKKCLRPYCFIPGNIDVMAYNLKVVCEEERRITAESNHGANKKCFMNWLKMRLNSEDIVGSRDLHLDANFSDRPWDGLS
jgi:hypothetical protein